MTNELNAKSAARPTSSNRGSPVSSSKQSGNQIAEPVKSAVRAVLDTTELLEAILLYLHFLTILQAQLVCQRFNTLIRASVVIKRALLKLPSGHTSKATESGTYRLCTEWEHLYCNEDDRRHGHCVVANDELNEMASQPDGYKLHPLFHVILKMVGEARYPSDQATKAKVARSASYSRDMLLIQPAMYRPFIVACDYRTDRGSIDHWWKWLVYGRQGAPLTLGDLYDGVMKTGIPWIYIIEWKRCARVGYAGIIARHCPF
ncbi:hypothetical protein LTR95_016553 [Oleoguttula sp. CCFEE 5521]